MPPLVDPLEEEEEEEQRQQQGFGSPSESGSSESFTVVSVDNIVSDGERGIWPTHPRYEPADPRLYLIKLATMWMKHLGKEERGEQYILDKLPEGFILMSRARKAHPELRDKFLYGHVSGLYFNSPNNFWPHFLYLATGRVTPCKCNLCKGFKGVPLVPLGEMPQRRRGRRGRPVGESNRGSARGGDGRRGRRPGRRPAHTYLAVDEEGTHDVYKELVHKLQTLNILDVEVKEPWSMDWRAERAELRRHLTRISMQYSFIPRVGELVLWCRDLQGEILFNPATDRFEQFDRKNKKYLGPPDWLTGVVTQVPEESISLRDIVEHRETNKKNVLNMSGFRVETLPDPNSAQKDLSSVYKYVPLCQIRPLNYWDILLQNVPNEDFHESIENALTVMSSFSLLDKYRFKGEWPNAWVYARGIYLGAELLTVGDGVRLMPRAPVNPGDPDEVTDVLVISSIRLRLSSCDADLSSPQLCKEAAPRIFGKAYTTSPRCAYLDPQAGGVPVEFQDVEVIDAFQSTGMRPYGPWYRLHAKGTEIEISINQILGRVYESDYMDLVFGHRAFGLDYGGILGSRDFSRQQDDRIAEGKEWFCGDSRVETLAVETLNGIEVGPHDDARDMVMWRATLRVIEGVATPADLRNAKIPRDQGRPITGVIGGKDPSMAFESVGRTNTMVRSAMEPSAPGSPTGEGPSDIGDVEENNQDEEESDEDEDQLVDILKATPFIRGGTSESSGGDYRPLNQPRGRGRGRGRRGRGRYY